MHIWIALAAREMALLTPLLLLGAGPASFLSDRFDAGSRIAMAPLLGFCVGTCVTTTLLQFAPTNDTYWLLVPLALASAGVAIVRARREAHRSDWRRRLPLRDLAALVLVGLAVAGPISYALHQRHTVGPAVYYYTDVDNYVSVQDAARTVSLSDAADRWHQFTHGHKQYSNLTMFDWGYLAQAGSNLDATPLDSNVNALLGLGATDTNAPFLAMLLLMGALGAFAAVRYFSRSRTPMAVIAGCMFGGPFFLELWFDSYQAAIIALGLVVPFLVLVDDAFREPRRGTFVLLSLLLATMLTVYPLYVAVLLAAASLMLGFRAIAIRRTGRGLRPLVRPVAITIVSIVGLAVLFDAVGFVRDITYYRGVLNGTVGFARVGYHLPLSVLPGWIAQTREFWNMPPLGGADFKQLLLGALVPLVFAGLIIVGLRRFRSAISLVVLGCVFAVVAEYAFASQQSCTYCAERNLLPLAPITAVLLALGLYAVCAFPTRWLKATAVLAAVLVVATVGQRSKVELTRFAHDSYFMDSSDRFLLSRLPSTPGSVEEEGFDASVAAQAEQSLVYHLITERAPGRASIVLGTDLGNAIQYLNFGLPQLPPGPEFNPDYRYVLTRFGAIATGRRVVARSGGMAVEERVSPLDVTPYTGLGAPLDQVERSGTAWVQTQYPLELLVAGYNGGRPAWARLTFLATVPVVVPRQPGVRVRRFGRRLVACVRATGAQPARQAALQIKANLVPGKPPNEVFPPGMPLEGLALTSMSAVSGSCSL